MKLQSIGELSNATTEQLTDENANSLLEVSLKSNNQYVSYNYKFTDLTSWINGVIQDKLDELSTKVDNNFLALSNAISDEVKIRKEQIDDLTLSVQNISGAYDYVTEWRNGLSDNYLALDKSIILTVKSSVVFEKVLTACTTSAYWN